jgi:hypothetical protein
MKSKLRPDITYEITDAMITGRIMIICIRLVITKDHVSERHDSTMKTTMKLSLERKTESVSLKKTKGRPM